MGESLEQKLRENIFGDIYNADIPTDDKGMFVMFSGLCIVEIQMGPFADLDISMDKQAELGITAEMANEMSKNLDQKKEKMILEWKSLISSYICDVKSFQKHSDEYRKWSNSMVNEYKLNSMEWTVSMYEWALIFLKIMRCKFLSEMLESNM